MSKHVVKRKSNIESDKYNIYKYALWNLIYIKKKTLH